MEINSILAGSTVAALFLAAAVWRPTIARIALFLLFAASALFNATVTFPARDHIYQQMIAGPYVPQIYRDFTLTFVVGNSALFTLLVVAFEVSIAVLILARGRAVKLALLGSAGWLLAMWLFAPAEGVVFTAIAQIGSALGCLLMLRTGITASVPAVLASRLRPRPDVAIA